MPPGYIDKNVLNSEPYSCYMDVEEDQIVLKNNVMIYSENVLILNDGKPVEVRLNEGEECKFVVSSHIKLDNCAKFLCLCKLPYGIVRGVTEQYRENESANGCVIIGTPGTGKTHFSLYFAFYIMRRYQEIDIIFEQLCKGTNEDSMAPTDVETKFTILLTMPRNDRVHEFEKKGGVFKYYSSLWVEKEILDVWKLNHNNIPEERVKELINVNTHSPKPKFKDKEFIPASEIVSKALYEKYKKTTKDCIINLIKNLAGDAAAPLSGKLFEMMAHDLLRKGGTFKVRNLSTGNCEILQLQELKQNVFHNIDEIVSMEY
ncbi:5516_t:CDS:2 [Funneliformis caledonium]|uniref:5516_t:CDS:1 n=1 Tax=Funneliformis caledonium TaxID=1117310 RepID=A0A9N9AFM3_9GLOM|nr:5516_t:CDS:2 [Funneliformis caledonium]